MSDQPPLSDDELQEIRMIIERDKRVKWLGSVARTTAVWVVAVIGGISLAYQTLGDAVKHLAGTK